MRIPAAIAIALMSVGSLANGQDTRVNYTWRSSATPVQSPVARVAKIATTPTAALPRTVSQPPAVNPPAAPAQPRVVPPNTVGQRISASQEVHVPAAPVMKRNKFLVSFRNQQEQAGKTSVSSELLDAQSSVSDSLQSLSDPADFSTEIPTAPVAPSSVVTDSASTPEPPLSVQSNAAPPEKKDEVSPYCNPPQRNRCNLGDEKKLFAPHCSGRQVGGWLSLGYHNRDNILVNNRRQQLALHQAWLYVDKTASSDTGGWDTGYRADALYGLDAQDLQAFGNSPSGNPSGWDNGWDNGSFGFALPQLYLQFANYDWDVKLGKFFSPFGYEVIGAPDNFFYSHSFTMYNSEPFTMTGILGERRVADNRSVVIGATAGWDTGFDSNSGGTLITGMRYQPNQYVDFALTSSFGDTGTRGTGRLTSGVAQMQLTENVSYVLQADFLDLNSNQEFGIVQYLFRDITDCLKLGARIEWWKSDQFFTSSRSSYEFTMGANYQPHANLRIRPEVRFDWGAAAIAPGQPIIGIDAVMTF